MAALVVVGGAADSAAAEVTLYIDKKCDAAFLTSDAKVSFARRDAVLWTVVSMCEKTQKVRIYPQAGEPFSHCEGVPAAANMGSEFSVSKYNPAYILCIVNWHVLLDYPDCKSDKADKICPKFYFGKSSDDDKSVTGAREAVDRPVPEKARGGQDLDPRTCCARGLPCCRAPELKLEVDP